MIPVGPTRSRLLVVVSATLVALSLSIVVGQPSNDDATPVDETVIIQLRIWQRVEHPEEIWISARPQTGRWSTLGTIPFPLDTESWGRVRHARHSYRDLSISGIEFRVWQRQSDPGRIFVFACGEKCLGARDFLFLRNANTTSGTEVVVPRWSLMWRPLGMIPVPLDAGHSPGGHYRYGDISVAVPRNNPGLLADRMHLLALQNALAAKPELNWNAGTRISDWEGVTVAGDPPRVTKVELAERGLTGELLGWIGNLTELTELRLEGNHLKGLVPSKLVLLELMHLRLSGNEWAGCIPPPLHGAANHDLAQLELPDCGLIDLATSGSYHFELEGTRAGSYRGSTIRGGTYYAWLMFTEGTHAGDLAFDLPRGPKAVIVHLPSLSDHDFDHQACLDNACSTIFHDPYTAGLVVVLVESGAELELTAASLSRSIWLLLDNVTGHELQRSHYEDESADFAVLERLAASIWPIPEPQPFRTDDPWITRTREWPQ